MEMRKTIDSYSSANLDIYGMLKYCFGWEDQQGKEISGETGKGLRPALCLFAAEALGGSYYKAIYAAISLELIHNFSLIHDEIQDFDEFRHHRPTLWAVWGPEKALVAGDVLKVIADKSIEDFGKYTVRDENNNFELHRECTKLLTEACLQMIEGQYLDITFEKEINVGIDQYLDMISKKTGALIRCSLNLGALIGTKDPNLIRIFKNAGTALGFGFQIKDDILGIWGTEDSTGKPVGSDIKRKKKSIPILHSINSASYKSKRILINIFQKEELLDNDIITVLSIMDDTKSLDYSETLAREYCDKSIDHIYSANLTDESMEDFIELAEFLALREF
jgi:geranylgeranyl diphosphate synthase type I